MKPIKPEQFLKAISLLLHNTHIYPLHDGTALVMPNLYKTLKPEKIKEMWDKWECGPGDGLGAMIIPDTMWGLTITPA